MQKPSSESVKTFRERYQREPAIIAQAPGRIEFLGNHTDYNLGQVLGVSIDRGTRVLLNHRPDAKWIFHSENQGRADWEMDIPSGKISPVRAGAAVSWVNYPLGVLEILRQKGAPLKAGFDFQVESDLPVGAGLSSSAALEIASALAFGQCFGVSFSDPLDLMRIGWRAETEFVGMPCGILDQTAVVLGRKAGCVWIDCKAEKAETIPLPRECRFWLFNTLEQHSLIDSLYAERHRECQEACKKLQVRYPEIKGLCDLSPEALEAGVEHLSEIELRRARHVVQENNRVKRAVQLLNAPRLDFGELGDFLNLSHASSRDLFENSTEHLDYLVDALQGQPKAWGARLTGGGFGGAVLAMTGPDFSQADAEPVCESYRNRFGGEVELIGVQAGAGAEVISPETH